MVQLDFNNIFDNLLIESHNELLEANTFNFMVKTKGLLDLGIKPPHNHWMSLSHSPFVVYCDPTHSLFVCSPYARHQCNSMFSHNVDLVICLHHLSMVATNVSILDVICYKCNVVLPSRYMANDIVLWYDTLLAHDCCIM